MFALEDEDKYRIGDKVVAPGLSVPLTKSNGILASYEVNKDYSSNQNHFFPLDLQAYSIGWLRTNLIQRKHCRYRTSRERFHYLR